MKIVSKTYVLVGILIVVAAVNLFLLYQIQQIGTAESYSIIRAGDLKVKAETIASLSSSIASGNSADRTALNDEIQSFEQVLDALQHGGSIRGQAIIPLPGEVSDEHSRVIDSWNSYKQSATTVKETSVFNQNVVNALNYVLDRNGQVVLLVDGINKELAELDRDYNRHKELATHLKEHAEEIGRQALLLSIGEEENVREKLREERIGFDIDLRKLLGIPAAAFQVLDEQHAPESLDPVPRANSDGLRDLEPIWEAVQFRIVQLEENSLLSPEFQAAKQELEMTKSQLGQNIDELLDSWNEKLNSGQSQQQVIIQVLLGVDIAVFFVVIFVIRHSLNPLGIITKGLSRVKEGIYGEKINYQAEDEVGELVKSFNIMSDTIKEKEEEAKKNDLAKDEFLAMITHELKTPLVPIQGYADLLLSEHLGKLTPKQKERLKIIRSSAGSLLDIISDLLDAQKLELGQLRLKKENNNIKSTIERAIEAYKPQLDGASIKIVKDLNDITVPHDPARIIQVLSNLIKNSMNAVEPKTGVIEITTQDLPSEVKISIKDNGIGIEPEKQKGLFKKFYQIDSSLTREKGGSGLGLAICKGIVEAHGGKMEVQSEPKVGSTFTLSLPKQTVPV